MTLHYPLTVYYDASCALCRSEVENIFARDWARDDWPRLTGIDCSAAGFDDSALPVKQAAMMNRIYARDAAGTWISGVDVFIAMYRAADLEWVSDLLANERVRPWADRAYPWVVRNRRRLSALGLQRVFKHFTHRVQRRQARDAWARSQACRNGACELHKE